MREYTQEQESKVVADGKPETQRLMSQIASTTAVVPDRQFHAVELLHQWMFLRFDCEKAGDIQGIRSKKGRDLCNVEATNCSGRQAVDSFFGSV